MSVMLAFAPSVSAHPLDGHWVLATSDEETTEVLHQAVEDSLQSFPGLIRGFVRPKLRKVVLACQAYDLQVVADAVSLACDAEPRFRRRVDGTRVAATGREGETVHNEARLSDASLEMDWHAKNGVVFEVFSASEDVLVLDARLTSPRLPDPILWRLTYAKHVE